MDIEGGHLFRPHSLKFPGDTITRLLYGLNQIPVISLPYSENKTPAKRLRNTIYVLSQQKGIPKDKFGDYYKKVMERAIEGVKAELD